MAYDFSRLTTTQKELLTYGGWSVGCQFPPVQPQPRTVAKLIARGLLVHRKTKYGAGFVVDEYEVPVGVHAAWCDHCAKYFKG